MGEGHLLNKQVNRFLVCWVFFATHICNVYLHFDMDKNPLGWCVTVAKEKIECDVKIKSAAAHYNL